jgi:hypothetical protein
MDVAERDVIHFPMKAKQLKRKRVVGQLMEPSFLPVQSRGLLMRMRLQPNKVEESIQESCEVKIGENRNMKKMKKKTMMRRWKWWMNCDHRC